jgi:hypothetical protein
MNVNWWFNRCRRYQEPIALLAAGLGSAAEQRRAEQHLDNCTACREQFRELSLLAKGLARLKTEAEQVRPGASLRVRWVEQIKDVREDDKPRSALGGRRPGDWGWAVSGSSWLIRGLGAAVCVLLAFALGYWHGRAGHADLLQNADVVRETLALFPNRVRAIVEDKRGLNLVLSDSDNVPVSAPLYIRVSGDGRDASYLTFSGQEITIAGQTVTVLADTHGGVILAGDHFLWSATDRLHTGGLKILAKSLGPIKM